MENRKVVALVPLRGGSKSIPDKNIKNLNGKPLCYYTLKAAADSEYVNEVYVSTDSKKIAKVVESLDLGVQIIIRPDELATDEASTEAVMLHFTENVEYDFLITMQATSPLTEAEDIDNSLRLFAEKKCDSMLTGVRCKRFYWSQDGKPLNYNPAERPRRQDFDGVLVENGAFYISTRDLLLKEKCRLGGKIGIYEMSEETYVEIDEPEDWASVEKLLRKKLRKNTQLGDVKVVMCDVDGTLTDGGMYYSADGELAKKFNTRDAKGLNMLKEQAIEIVVVTREDSPAVKARMKKLGIKEYYPGVKDKVAFVERYCQTNSYSFTEIAFIGDVLTDLECLKMVGFAACPADAVEEVREVSDYFACRKAVDGAVREICDYLMKHK